MSDDDNATEYHLEKIPAKIFTGGLTFDQEQALASLMEAMDRGENYLVAMSDGNQELIDEFEPLHRFLHGIAVSAVLPIVKMVTEGADPAAAMASVIAGVGGMFFFGGMEYAKMMGLDGVGVDLPTVEKPNDDPTGKYHPEEMPDDRTLSLDELLKRFVDQPDSEEE